MTEVGVVYDADPSPRAPTDILLEYLSAPRSARLYSALSGEGLEELSLGLLTYLAGDLRPEGTTVMALQLLRKSIME